MLGFYCQHTTQKFNIMKKFLKIGGAVVGVIVLAIVILAFVAPTEYSVTRSVTIDADRSTVWSHVNSNKRINEWSPWDEKDPNLTSSYTGTEGAVGSIYSWSGNEDVGTGEQEITAIDPMNSISTELRFKEPFEDVGQAAFLLDDDGTGTKVTWKFDGKSPFPMNIMFMLFVDMDKNLGTEFDKGLGYLKKLIEG